MTPGPLILPATLQERLGDADPKVWTAVGNAELLNEPLLGLLASRQCPPRIMLSTLDRIPGWIADGQVILSGFHSPLEQQVFHSILRRKGRAVKLLARGLASYSIPPKERPALQQGRLLVLTAFPPAVRRTTRATALARNRLVQALAPHHHLPTQTTQPSATPTPHNP